jgi:uncharacterized OsmC-like protein
MRIAATIRHYDQTIETSVDTEGAGKSIALPAKQQGKGSGINGGELLFLSLATCFCNDIYREAAKRQMQIEGVEVTVTGTFGKEGETGSNIAYSAKVIAPAHSAGQIRELIEYVDSIAEIHNTLRRGASVRLES